MSDSSSSSSSSTTRSSPFPWDDWWCWSMKSSVSLLHVLAPRIIETASDSYDRLYVKDEGRWWWWWWCWEMNSDMVVAALSRHKAMSWKWEWDVGRENRLLESADLVVLLSLVVVISEVVVVVDNSSGSSGEDGSSVRVAIEDSSSDCSIGIGLLLDSSSSVGLVANDSATGT